MCNAYRLRTPISQIAAAMEPAKLPLRFPMGVPNLEPIETVRPTVRAPILRAIDAERPHDGLELATLRWGMIPWFHKGGLKDWKFLTTNARSESVETTRTYRDSFRRRRCLVPADGFYEWTGPKGAKTKHLFTRADGALFVFPGLWDRWDSAEGPVESYTLLTCAPGEDVRAYHDRQPIILEPEQYACWLDSSSDCGHLLRGSEAGSLRVEPPLEAAA